MAADATLPQRSRYFTSELIAQGDMHGQGPYKGAAEQTKGAIKEAAGKLAGNLGAELNRAQKKATGKTRRRVGEAPGSVRDALDKVRQDLRADLSAAAATDPSHLPNCTFRPGP